MTIEKKLELLTKIINSCDTPARLETARRWVRRTSFWTQDTRLLNTCVKLIETADVDEMLDGRLENYGDTYDCEEYIKSIQKKRGIILEVPL